MAKKARVKLSTLPDKKLFPLLVEAVDQMKLTPTKRHFAHAVMRAAIEYAAMRQAGFVFQKSKD